MGSEKQGNKDLLGRREQKCKILVLSLMETAEGSRPSNIDDETGDIELCTPSVASLHSFYLGSKLSYYRSAPIMKAPSDCYRVLGCD